MGDPTTGGTVPTTTAGADTPAVVVSGPAERTAHGATPRPARTDLVDPAMLTALAAELGSADAAGRIGHTYVRLLDSRVRRITAALAARDEEVAMDVLLSLRVTSATLGATALDRAVLAVIDAVRRGSFDDADLAAEGLDLLAARSALALTAVLDDLSGVVGDPPPLGGTSRVGPPALQAGSPGSSSR